MHLLLPAKAVRKCSHMVQSMTKMHQSTIQVKEDGIYRCNERSNSSEPMSNFTVKLTTSVDCDKSAECGGPGFLTMMKRFPDEVER